MDYLLSQNGLPLQADPDAEETEEMLEDLEEEDEEDQEDQGLDEDSAPDLISSGLIEDPRTSLRSWLATSTLLAPSSTMPPSSTQPPTSTMPAAFTQPTPAHTAAFPQPGASTASAPPGVRQVIFLRDDVKPT